MATNPANFAHDLVRTQMIMGLGNMNGSSWAPLQNLVFLNLYDRAVSTFPQWWPNLKAFCCRRQKPIAATPPPPSNKEVKCTITCERILHSGANKQAQQLAPVGNHVRMDAVVNYVTTIPVIRNLICMTQQADYLPNEFEPVQIEPDLYFQLTDLKHNDGQIESIKFKLFCYDNEVQYLQSFVDRCNAAYDRKMKNI